MHSDFSWFHEIRNQENVNDITEPSLTEYEKVCMSSQYDLLQKQKNDGMFGIQKKFALALKWDPFNMSYLNLGSDVFWMY